MQVFNPQTRRFEQQLRMHYQQVAFDVVGVSLGIWVAANRAWVPCCTCSNTDSCCVQVFEKQYTAEEEGSAVYASYKCVPATKLLDT